MREGAHIMYGKMRALDTLCALHQAGEQSRVGTASIHAPRNLWSGSELDRMLDET